jgi:hypothetical protein
MFHSWLSVILGEEWDWVRLIRRPLFGLLYQPRMMDDELKLKLNYDRQSVGHSVLVSGSHLELMTRFLFSVWQLRVSCCAAPSLTRGCVCNLLVQLLLGLSRAVTLGVQVPQISDRILLSHLRLPQPGGPGPRVYIPQEQGVEQSMEWLVRETEILREKLPQCHFVHHKPHMSWQGLEPSPPRWQASG